MQNVVGFISSELRFPLKTSKKKKRYVTFACPNCGKVEEKIYIKTQFVNLCSHCAKGGFTTKDFIQRGIEHFGDKYSYSKTIYINKRTKVTITCPIHGDFEQQAQEHLGGHGCNQCKFDIKREIQILPKEVWLDRICKYPLIKFKDTNQIKNYHGYVDLKCKIHGDFAVQLGSVGTSTHLCKQCAYTAHQSQSIRPEHIGKLAYLYYVYLPDIDMYKFGVTLDKSKRFAQLGNTVLIAEGTKEYTEAIRLEHLVMTKLDKYRYKGRELLIKNGSTELFKQNVLSQIKRALQG
jgi:predicted RNA-binding Zn-ribbon protein involved in translation (DUF1610 family)